MDVGDLHARSTEVWLAKVEAVPADRWTAPTPCPDWDLRALVNHVVGEDRWTAPLVGGETIAQVGSRFDGDLLGDDPTHAAREAARDAVHAFAAPDALRRTVHLSVGDTPAEEYAWQLTADHLVHAWDVAAAAGIDRSLDQDVVERVADWFSRCEDRYRKAGVIGARPTAAAASPADALLVAFGRDPAWKSAPPAPSI